RPPGPQGPPSGRPPAGPYGPPRPPGPGRPMPPQGPYPTSHPGAPPAGQGPRPGPGAPPPGVPGQPPAQGLPQDSSSRLEPIENRGQAFGEEYQDYPLEPYYPDDADSEEKLP